MAYMNVEQRSSPRTRVDAPVQCQFTGISQIGNALVENISATGFLIWTDSDICPHGEMRIWLESDFEGVPPIDIRAEVVRTEVRDHARFAFGYGCRILDT